MPHLADRSLNAVEQAALMAQELTEGVQSDEGTKQSAARAAARRAGISFAQFSALLQPSRRRKYLDVAIWQRMRAAYLAHLRRKLVALQAEIVMAEALDASDRATLDLLDDAKALVSKIESALRSSAG